MKHAVTFKWTEADQVPTIDEPVVCITKNKKICVLNHSVGRYIGDTDTEDKHIRHWEFLKSKYNIEYWTYQSDLMI